ncbi:MAG: hypothetical protein ACTSPB_09090 [Candidatus Thorarchaeota archaeon]
MHKKVLSYLKLHSRFLYYKKKLKKAQKRRRIILEDITRYPEVYKVDQDLANEMKEVLDDDLYEGGEMYDLDDPENRDFTHMSEDEIELQEMRLSFLVSKLPTDISDDISNYAVESLEQLVDSRRVDLLRVSKLLIALSFDKADVEPAPPVVIMKPESPPPRVSMPTQFRSSREMQEITGYVARLEYEISRQNQNRD